jgi:hypothetical protein
MNKEFIPYEPSLALKEIGFDEWCYKVYEKNSRLCNTYESTRWQNENPELVIGAPLYQQAFSFFREKYGLPSHIATYWQHDWNNYSYQYYFVQDKVEWNGIEHYKTYEEAKLACLNKLIEIVKQK